ncbi:MAG: Cell division protein FtsH, partial [uncultured Solirubrobacteraceae bacterium]
AHARSGRHPSRHPSGHPRVVRVGEHLDVAPDVGAADLHADHRHRPVADDEADAADEARGDQAERELGDGLARRRRRRRGEGGARGGRRVPQGPGALPPPGRDRPEGHPAPRPARHRQDAARQGRRAGVRRALLLAVGRRVRGDVRGPRRRAHPASLRDRPQARAGDHLHRRARRGGRRPRVGHGLRARADAQPAPGRDGRVQHARPARGHRRLQPAREARSRAPAPRPLRPPDLRLAARRGWPRGDPRRPHAHEADRPDGRPRAARAPDRRAHGRRPRQHRQRGGDLRGPLASRRDRPGRLRRSRRARRRRHAVAPHAQRPRAAGRRLPRGGPRAVRRAAAPRRPRAQDLDRAARAGAGLHAQPARGGPLPQDPRGAHRLHDRPA